MLLRIKKCSEKLLMPLGKKLRNIPANYFTFLGLIFAILVFIEALYNLLLFMIVSLFFIEFFDQLDGIVARLQGPTKWGAFLDSTFDRIGDSFVFLGMIFGGYTSIEIGLIGLIGAFLTSYTRAKIESLSNDVLYGVGLLERTDRIPIIMIGGIFQIWFPRAIWWTMLFLAIGVNLTAIQRTIFAHRKFIKKKNKH